MRSKPRAPVVGQSDVRTGLIWAWRETVNGGTGLCQHYLPAFLGRSTTAKKHALFVGRDHTSVGHKEWTPSHKVTLPPNNPPTIRTGAPVLCGSYRPPNSSRSSRMTL